MARRTFKWLVPVLLAVVVCSCGEKDNADESVQDDDDSQDTSTGDDTDDGDSDDDDDDDNNDDDSDSDSDTDTDTATDPDVDALTSATPTVDSAIITSSHTGWANNDCNTCHIGMHNRADYRPPDCVTCHGTNGAPFRLNDCGDTGCTDSDCHPDQHPGFAFNAPGDCRSCHVIEAPADDSCLVEGSYDAVVIGAGGGGLSAAAYLANNGMSVLVLEKHYKAGGYMVSFNRGQYTFEASLHGFDGLEATVYDSLSGDHYGYNVDVFEALGIQEIASPIRCDPMYKTHFPGEEHRINVPADAPTYIAMLKEMFPEQADGLDGLFAELSKIDQVMRIIMRYQNKGEDVSGFGINSLALIAEMTTKGLLNTLTSIQDYMNSGEKLASFLGKYIDDEKLIGIFTELSGFLGGGPDDIAAIMFIVMWNSYHFGGYYFFDGGSQNVTDSLIEVIEDNGGEIRYNSLVTKIDIEDGLARRVRIADGSCFEADYVVSNANARTTMLDMVGAEYLPTDPESPFYPAKLEPDNDESMVPSMTMIQVYLGVDIDYSDLFEGAHEVMVAESYDQAENFASYANSEVDEVSYAILNYSVVDDDLAPEGKNSITIGTILAFDWEEQWHWAEDHAAYQEFAEEIAWRFIERAEEDFLPELSQHIEVMEVGTPQTMRGFTLSPVGAIMGWDSRPSQTLDNRLPQQTPIDNLLLAGAWTAPGGGQSQVLASGLLAGIVILGKE